MSRIYNPVECTCSQRLYLLILIAITLVLCVSDTKATTVRISRSFDYGFPAPSINFTNHPDLESLWRRYEQSAPDYSAIPLTLHGSRNYHHFDKPSCDGKHYVGAAAGTYAIDFNIEGPCTYSIQTKQGESSSLICSGLTEFTNSYTCSEDTVRVHHEDGVTFHCGSRILLFLPSSALLSRAVRGTLTYIQCAIVVEEAPSASPHTAEGEVSGANITTDAQICPIQCGVSAPSRAAALTRIVGGDFTASGEVPWQAVVVMQGFTRSVGVCGGSLINSRFVLSAAHCFETDAWMAVRFAGVFLGLDYLQQVRTTAAYPVRKVFVHPLYQLQPFVYNDAALLQLALPVQFTPHVGPVCLPDPNTDYARSAAMVTGFGKTATFLTKEAPLSPVLKKTNVNIVENWECALAYKIYRVVVDEKIQICTRGLFSDSCKGDSGSAVVVKNEATGRFEQVGIVSFGITCTDVIAPSVNTRVSSFADWIKKTVGRLGTCE